MSLNSSKMADTLQCGIVSICQFLLSVGEEGRESGLDPVQYMKGGVPSLAW